MLEMTHEYKFKKGDSLDDIAKKHGVKDANLIWKLPDNKGIVSKRGKPDQLQAGDVLVLPPSEKELKQAHDTAVEAIAALDAEIARTTQKLSKIDKLINDTNIVYLGLVKELIDNKAHVKNMGDAADAAAMLAQMGTSLTKITLKGASAAKAAEAELEKMNKELISEAKSMVTNPMQTGTAKALATCASSTNPVVIFIGVLGDSFDKMTSPSFWASTFTQLLAGKTWSEAVTTNITDELDTQVLGIQKQRNDQLKMLIAHRKSLEPLIGKLQSQKKQIETDMKALH